MMSLDLLFNVGDLREHVGDALLVGGSFSNSSSTSGKQVIDRSLEFTLCCSIFLSLKSDLDTLSFCSKSCKCVNKVRAVCGVLVSSGLINKQCEKWGGGEFLKHGEEV